MPKVGGRILAGDVRGGDMALERRAARFNELYSIEKL